MIDEPHIADSAETPAAVIRFTIPRAEIRSVMGPAMRELLAVVAEQGVGPAGPIFSHHFRMDPEVFDFEVGAPVHGPVRPVGRVRPGALPAAKVLRTIYRGGYEGLGAAWAELEAWIAADGRRTAPNLWERYVLGPQSTSDPTLFQTELNRPLA